MKPTILYVEDDLAVQRMLVRSLAGLGDIELADSVGSGLYAMNRSMRWDVFLFDLQLPDGDAWELLIRAQATHPNTPRILLTGQLDRDAMVRAQDQNTRYLIKGGALHVVVDAVHHAINQNHQLSEDLRILLSHLAKQWQLSPAEAVFLESEVSSLERGCLLNGNTLAEETCRGYQKKILAKARTYFEPPFESWDNLRRHLQREITKPEITLAKR